MNEMIFTLAVTQPVKMLKNLANFMEKGLAYAQAKKFEPDVWLNMRLAPDQFAFVRQIQIACDAAKFGASRITGKEAPTQADTEKTWAELKTRIESTVQFLQSLKPADFEGALTRKVTQPRWEGKYLTGEEFLVQHALPNVYFHITTAYSILRSSGVDVGKKDFLGEMPFKQ
jgi:uncharacterized protein